MPDPSPDPLKAAFLLEWQLAEQARQQGDLNAAFAYLERAHILSQRRTGLHVLSHIGLLRLGWQRRDRREIFGQLTRIVAAALFSRILVPVGNTGGADVSPLLTMPVPADLAAIVEAERLRRR